MTSKSAGPSRLVAPQTLWAGQVKKSKWLILGRRASSKASTERSGCAGCGHLETRARQRSLITRLRLWRSCMICSCIVTFLPFTAQTYYGLEIISRSVSPTYAAVGDSVTLSCHFNLAPEDLGVLDIEWSIVMEKQSFQPVMRVK